MLIRWVRGESEKQGTMTCLRADGSSTWQKSTDYFVYHDLVHYAVETTLGYRQAFLGLVAQGRDLDSFGTQNGVRDTYTPEVYWAEEIAAIVQLPDYSGGPPLTDAELHTLLMEGCEARGVVPPAITTEQLGTIRACARELHARWAQIPEGGVLELIFPPV